MYGHAFMAMPEPMQKCTAVFVLTMLYTTVLVVAVAADRLYSLRQYHR